MTQSKIEIKEVDLDIVAAVSSKIVEFDEIYSTEYFVERIKDKKSLIIAGFVESQPAGYLVCYEVEAKVFYCWMAAVDPKFRRKGVLSQMMVYLFNWAKANAYMKITIKTRNSRREMLAYLVNNSFNFTSVETRPVVNENRIYLEKLVN